MANLTDAQIKVLRILYEEKIELHDRALGPGYIGDRIWGKNRKPQAYARTAGKVLNALREKGLADWMAESVILRDPDYGWMITTDGYKVMEELNDREKRKTGKKVQKEKNRVHRDKQRRR